MNKTHARVVVSFFYFQSSHISVRIFFGHPHSVGFGQKPQSCLSAGPLDHWSGFSRGLLRIRGISCMLARMRAKVVLGFFACGCNGGDFGTSWLSSELKYNTSVSSEAVEPTGLRGGLWGCFSVVLLVWVSKDISVCDL